MGDLCPTCTRYREATWLGDVTDALKKTLFQLWLSNYVGQEIVLREFDEFDCWQTDWSDRSGILTRVLEGDPIRKDREPDTIATSETLWLFFGVGLLSASICYADGLSWYVGWPMYAIGSSEGELEHYGDWLWREHNIYYAFAWCTSCDKSPFEQSEI